MAEITRVPATKCLRCGHKLDAIGAITEECGPRPGDPIACIRCGAAMTIGEDGALRGFTDDEMEALLADADTMDELARMVERIHFVKHAAN